MFEEQELIQSSTSTFSGSGSVSLAWSFKRIGEWFDLAAIPFDSLKWEHKSI